MMIYYRLISIWVLCEAMLGGIIHGLRIPVSGLVVGSAAVICITLIAWFIPERGAIIKATIIVAIFKMMLSPQSPPPAYIAVFFQGVVGELIFHKRRMFGICCMLLAVLALVESGIQRIIVLTIVMGNDIWAAIDQFIQRLTKQNELTNYSFYIAGVYVLIHLVAGVIVGLVAARLPSMISKWREQYGDEKLNIEITKEPVTILPGKKRAMRLALTIVWIVLILLLIQSYFKIGQPLLPQDLILNIIIRSLVIVLSWYFLAKPIVTALFRQWLQKKQKEKQKEIVRVYDLLPSTKTIVVQSWQRASAFKGIKKIREFTKLTLVKLVNE